MKHFIKFGGLNSIFEKEGEDIYHCTSDKKVHPGVFGLRGKVLLQTPPTSSSVWTGSSMVLISPLSAVKMLKDAVLIILNNLM